MALSGTIYGSVTHQPASSKPFSFYFTWSATQNVSGNYSDVTVNTYWKTTSTAHTFDTVGSRNASITINGTTTSITKVFNCNPWPSNPFLIQTATTRVYHNSDGTKSISISVRANGHAASWGPSSSTASSADCTASETITLDTIPRSSTITSASNITLGNACSIKWTPANLSFKYKIKFSIGNWNYTTDYISPLTTSAYTYTGYTILGATTSNNTTIYKQLPNDTSGTMTATLTTYNSSNEQIGTSESKTFTVTIPSNVKPRLGTITVDPVNITTLDGTSRNILVKDKNSVNVSISGSSAGEGSTIKSYTFEVLKDSTVIAKKTTTSASMALGPFPKTGELKFRVTVTDNRERSTNNEGSEQTLECYDYGVPSFRSFDIYRAENSSGTANMNGTYIRCNYVTEYYSVGATNNITVTAYYNGKSQTGSSDNININLNGDSSTTYKVYLEIKDNYGGTSSTSVVTVFGESRILNITSDGTGVAIGKMATSSNLFECRWPAKFDGNLTVGDSSQNSVPTGGITVHDVRNADITPDSFGDKNVNFYFDDQNGWKSIMHMKGWTGDYAAWELAGNAHNSASLPYSNLYYRQGIGEAWGDWQTVLTDKNIGSYAAASNSLNNYLPLSGGTLTGKLILGGNLYYNSGSAGVDCQNSDIINVNGIYFKDASDSAGESINFYRSDGYWDTLYAAGGALKFYPNRSTSGSLSGYTIYNSSNFRRGTCTLSSSGETTVTFSSALGGTPTVMLTPLTSTTGVIPGKVKSASSTGFTAVIGGSAVSSALFAYLAVYF